jgi:toxin-antitoxin system PIN domain toxin
VSVAIDTNVLLYGANRRDPAFPVAQGLIEQLVNGPELVYVFWPVVMGFVRLSTHSGVADEPLTPEHAIGLMRSLIERPNVRTPGEQPGFLDLYAATAPHGTRGNHVPDAHIAALMRQNGVRVIYTRDRDFRRYDGIEPRDPFATG